MKWAFDKAQTNSSIHLQKVEKQALWQEMEQVTKPLLILKQTKDKRILRHIA